MIISSLYKRLAEDSCMALEEEGTMADGHADHARCAGRRDRVAALLELAAADDAAGFRAALDAAGGEQATELVNGVELWRGRSDAYEPRTPLMVAAARGSAAVVELLLGLGFVDVNRRPGVDGATALHCAASGGAPNAVAVVRSLLAAGADPVIPDSAGRIPADVVVHASPDIMSGLEALLGRRRRGESTLASLTIADDRAGKKEYPADPTLPDMSSSSSLYSSDEFSMFAFKVQACARTYAHDWTECPFVHPGENARRRDPRRHAYSAVPCASFRVAGAGYCPRGDACDFAHGVFETWLHPSQYRTRTCRGGAACARRICFFAHAEHELRHVTRDDPAAGAGLLFPRAMDDMAAAALELLPGSPTGGGGHCLQQGTSSRLRNSLLIAKSLDEHVGELGALLDLASLSGSSLARLPPTIRPPATYVAPVPPSRFGCNDHGGGFVYSSEAARTSQLLARIRQHQQGVRRLPAPALAQQRKTFERPLPSPTTIIKRQQMQTTMGSPAPACGNSDDSRAVNIACPSSKVDWSFHAELGDAPPVPLRSSR